MWVKYYWHGLLFGLRNDIRFCIKFSYKVCISYARLNCPLLLCFEMRRVALLDLEDADRLLIRIWGWDPAASSDGGFRYRLSCLYDVRTGLKLVVPPHWGVVVVFRRLGTGGSDLCRARFRIRNVRGWARLQSTSFVVVCGHRSRVGVLVPLEHKWC